MFNDWIDAWGSMEIKNPTREFTWFNNQQHRLWLCWTEFWSLHIWKVDIPLSI